MLKAGIYHKLNVTNPRERCTANQYLEKLKSDLRKRDLSTILARIPNTEPFWKRPRNNLRCLVEHYGPATWFLTLRPSEWLWFDMIKYIKDINAPDIDKMVPNKVIATDPASVSRFIDNKFHAMIEFIYSKDCPLGEVTHHFWRREYQGRGTQHFHCLLWVKNAPIIGE